jgi:hypothetical protein
MQTFAQFALPGTILASAVGAVVLCILLLLYGLKSEPDDERAPGNRLLVIRLGHALAAACFAAALMLSTVALIEQRRVAATATASSGDEIQHLADHVDTLEQRLAATELRLGDVESARTVAASLPAAESPPPAVLPASPRAMASVPKRRPAVSPPTRPSAVGPASMREPGEAAIVRTGSSAPAAAAATRASSSDDFGARTRNDWEDVKHGFREAGRDIRSGFSDFGRRIKGVFN